ncbi:MAG: dUTP diphosphatase [Deltaproteobacteria bacterium]|nr:dUTP diphosphatase [Deltaproteobacteria bacterium]
MNSISVKLEGEEKSIPEYSSDFAAGADLKAAIDDVVILKAGQRTLIGTGLKMEIPVGFEAQIRPRSGLALKHGISVVNSPGTIDSDYRGEIKVILINHGDEDFVINPYDRIAQIIFAPVITADFVMKTKLSDSKRDTDGFGSTGK